MRTPTRAPGARATSRSGRPPRRSQCRPSLRPHAIPSFPGSRWYHFGDTSSNIKIFQDQMHKRGYFPAGTGQYGPERWRWSSSCSGSTGSSARLHRAEHLADRLDRPVHGPPPTAEADQARRPRPSRSRSRSPRRPTRTETSRSRPGVPGRDPLVPLRRDEPEHQDLPGRDAQAGLLPGRHRVVRAEHAARWSSSCNGRTA